MSIEEDEDEEEGIAGGDAGAGGGSAGDGGRAVEIRMQEQDRVSEWAAERRLGRDTWTKPIDDETRGCGKMISGQKKARLYKKRKTDD